MNGSHRGQKCPRKGARMSQNELILDYLKSGKSINPMIALKKFHCFRLASRIADLRARGHEIKRSITTDTNAEGDTVRYATYWLEREKND